MYFMRTILIIKRQLQQLVGVIRTEFILAISFSDTDRNGCPSVQGSIWISISSEPAQKEYKFSTILSKNLPTNISNQQPQFATNNNAKKIKRKIKLTKMQHHNEELQKLPSTLSDKQKRLNELNREQGASS